MPLAAILHRSKYCLALLAVSGLLLISSVAAMPGTASAAGTTGQCPKPTFFGLEPWYQFLTVNKIYTGKNQNGTKNQNDYSCSVCFNLFNNAANDDPNCAQDTGADVPKILLAIIDDLLRIAGLAAVGLVIYGGIRYISSQGDPEETSKAQSTIVSALIGLAIAIVAVAFVSFLGNQLAG